MYMPGSIDEFVWIAIHTFTGYEDKVAETILKTAEARGISDQIVATYVPKETVIRTKILKEKMLDPVTGKPKRDSDGKIIYQEKKETSPDEVPRWPNYVFVKVGVVYKDRIGKNGETLDEREMELTEVAWYVIRNTRGVTAFVGPNKKPTALSDEEVSQFGIETKVLDINYEVGDTVEVVFGEFKGQRGVVESIDTENERVKVLTSMFMGSETSVELAYDCVTLAED